MSAPSSESEPPRILLIDDSPDELRLLSDMLRVERFRLTVASDGRQGYQRAVVVQPDLILLDVVMPQMDGFAASRLLKADPATRDIPLIFLTSMNAPEQRLQGFRLGGVDYVSKPFLAEEVIARIRIHLNRSRRVAQGAANVKSPESRHPDEVLARAVAALIQDNLGNLPPLPAIAHRVGTHEKRLRQIFRARFGVTVATFVREERIRAASRLLTETGMGIGRIAEEVGFLNARNFSTAFRERMGATPGEYRRALGCASEDEDGE